MVTINCAYTEPINPAGATPVLTRDQVWKGLQRKIRHAQDFVPVIDGCRVVSEEDNTIVRVAHFKGMNGGEGFEVEEVCKSYYPTKVDFWQPSGALITNTVSTGESLREEDMNMTYTFEWRDQDVKEGSEEHMKLTKEKVQMAKMAVNKSIEAMRKMAAAGELD